MPSEVSIAIQVENLCRRYPAYTPDTARRASVRTLRHMAILDLLTGEQ